MNSMRKGLITLGYLIMTFAFGIAQQNSITNWNAIQGDYKPNDSLSFEVVSLDSERLKVLESEVSSGIILSFKEDWKQNLLNTKPKKLSFSLLSPEGNLIELDLVRTAGALDNSSIRLASSEVLVNAPSAVHYRGEIRDLEGSSVGISILGNEIMGVFFWGGQSYTLGKLESQEPGENLHIFYPNTKLLLDFPDLCHITENHNMSAKKPAQSESSNTDNCVHMYFEVTHDIFLDKGDLPATLDYINGALSQVIILFENEDINLEVSEILVWDVPDPYDGPSSGDYLVQFRNELDGNYNGDLAALLGYGGGGGVAYLDVLCNNFFGVSYSGIGSSYNEVPQYSWTIMVISHEIGHNIGSPHTHACFWNGDDTMIDGCGPEAGYPQNPNCPVGPLPPTGGTVMSYCHLIGGTGINLGEGFHPQVVDLFEDEISNASCLGPCESTIPTADFGVVETQLCEESTVQFYSLSSANTTEWDWSFPGGSPSSSSEENPLITYNNPGSYDVILEVTSAAGETDELVMSDYISVDNNGSEVLIYQDFENGLGDYVVNNSSGPSFEITTNGSGSTYGASALWLDNYNNSNGDFDELRSPVFSLLAYNSATLYIDYAVTRRNNVSDSLVIYASRDGGASFEHVVGFFENGSGTYSTHTNTNSEFTPENADQWCLSGTGNSCLEIDLSSFTREDNVQLQIRNKHFGGNNLFIDRLWIQTDCYDLDVPSADFSADPAEGCASMVVEFTDLSTEFPQSHDWIFDGGIPNNSSDPNPTIIYDQPGEYAVTLTVTNPEGTDTETKIGYIMVGDDPTADFEIDITDRTVDFTYIGERAISFDWLFGDGNGSTEENPTHTYVEDGEYNVELTVTNDCGTATTELSVVISTLPVAEIDISSTQGCEPLSVFFDASESGNTDDYYWEFDGGSPSSSTNDTVNVTYSEPGTYDVLFIASNENGDDTIYYVDHISVDPLPHAEFNTGLNDLTATFYNLSQDYTDVFWDFGDGETTSSNSPEHTYEDVGTYTVQLVASNGCGADTFLREIEVYVPVEIDFSANPEEGCAALAVQFANNTVYADSLEWVFEGGIPNTSSETNPSVLYENEGNFDVQLIAWNAQYTDTLTLSDYIHVNESPTAGFSFTANETSVQFSNSSSTSTSYSWDFGDGNTSTAENPIHEYASDGTYLASLIAMNGCGSDTSVRQIIISTDAIAGFTANTLEGCPGVTIEFIDQSSANTTEWSWIFEGGSPTNSSEQDPVVSYDSPGTYDVTLIASSSNGSDTLSVVDYITIYELPSASFAYNVNDRQLTLENQSNHSTSYYWDFGDGSSSSEESPTHEYTQDGIYDVELSAINECDTSNFSLSIEVFTLPTSDFSASVTEGCGDLVVEFQNSSTENALDFQWFFPGADPEVSFEENPEVIYFVPGLHTVTLIVSNPSGADTLMIEEFINIYPSPQPFFDYDVDSLTISFEDLSSYVDRYYWDFGDGQSDTTAQPTHTYAVDSSYEVTLMGMNDCDTVRLTRTVGTEGLPQAKFNVLGERLGCVPLTVELNNETAGDGIEYQWIFPGGSPDSSDAVNPSVTYDSAGIYPITLIAYNANGSNQFTLQNAIRVIELPSSSFTFSSQTDFTYSFQSEIEGEEITNVQWFFGDGNGSSEENPSHTFEADGVYDVMLVVSNICGNDTAGQTIQIQTTSVTSFEDKSLQVYPNPAQDRVFISPWPADARIEIHNSLGAIKEVWRPSSTNRYLSVHRLPAGMYFIHIIRDQDRITAPLIIQR